MNQKLKYLFQSTKDYISDIIDTCRRTIFIVLDESYENF